MANDVITSDTGKTSSEASESSEATVMTSEPVDDFVSVLSRTLAQANRFLVRELHAAGLGTLTTSHGDILRQLFDTDGLSMCTLAERVDRDPSTVTTLVKRLAAEGYVTTARSEHDRRTVVVSLTEQGRLLQTRVDTISMHLHEVESAGLDASELAEARRVLLAVQDNFRRALEEEPEKKEPETSDRTPKTKVTAGSGSLCAG